MKSFILATLLLSSQAWGGVLFKRAEKQQTCANIKAASNNGDRKVAIVIDSSLSMLESDPTNLRLDAGRAVNDWLISKKEATGGKKADLVTVIDFAYSPTLDYPLGDPEAANATFGEIGSYGGTYIAGGVDMAITELTKSGTGSTDKRSGILVFTDGEVRNLRSRIQYVY